MSDSVLEQLVFQAVPLGEPLPKWPPNLSVQLPTGHTSTAGIKTFQLSSPFFAKNSPIPSADVNWPAYCGLLRDTGVLLQASYNDVAALSDVNVPQRIVRRSFNEGFDLVDLSCADAVLIDCTAQVAGQKCSRLPLEISGWHELKLMVDSLRQVVGPGTPIGLNILAGDIYTDVSNALAVRVDYVVLEFHSNSSNLNLDHLAWSVVAARNTCIQSGNAAFPVLIEAPLTNIEQMVKLLTLGATMLSIDAMVAESLPTTTTNSSVQVPKGLLSGIGSLPVKATPNVQPVANKLNELLERVRSRVFQQHLSELSSLSRDHLRGLTEHAVRVCGVKLLQHEP